MANEKKVSMPSWVAWWQFITGIICIIDATYIILRPRTMKSQGGDLNWLYSPSKILAFDSPGSLKVTQLWTFGDVNITVILT